MNIHYDNEVDALYLKLGTDAPDGCVELSEGINLDTTCNGKIVGIEILKASVKINLNTILSYSLELDENLLIKNVA